MEGIVQLLPVDECSYTVNSAEWAIDIDDIVGDNGHFHFPILLLIQRQS